jgi:cupin fold WbuC family metalloprotein
MKIVDRKAMRDLCLDAVKNPRLRKNLNLHNSYEDASQRLLNAMEPGSYIRPHRHLNDPKEECFIGIQGRVALIIFDDEGNVTSMIQLGPAEDTVCVDVSVGVWHTVVALEPGSVFFETKKGPYLPVRESDFAPWAPSEDSKEKARVYLAKLVDAVALNSPERRS